jgi:drug/metabolite transporter (DMT)-like permease
MGKYISPLIPNIELTGILSFLGFLIFSPFSIYQGVGFDFSSVSNIAWILMVYFGAIFTVLAYLFWFKGVEKVSGNTAGCSPPSCWGQL